MGMAGFKADGCPHAPKEGHKVIDVAMRCSYCAPRLASRAPLGAISRPLPTVPGRGAHRKPSSLAPGDVLDSHAPQHVIADMTRMRGLIGVRTLDERDALSGVLPNAGPEHYDSAVFSVEGYQNARAKKKPSGGPSVFASLPDDDDHLRKTLGDNHSSSDTTPEHALRAGVTVSHGQLGGMLDHALPDDLVTYRYENFFSDNPYLERLVNARPGDEFLFTTRDDFELSTLSTAYTPYLDGFQNWPGSAGEETELFTDPNDPDFPRSLREVREAVQNGRSLRVRIAFESPERGLLVDDLMGNPYQYENEVKLSPTNHYVFREAKVLGTKMDDGRISYDWWLIMAR